MMPRIWLTAVAIGIASLQPNARAMSVRAPTFPELVAESTVVARAQVVSVTSRSTVTANGTRAIKTFVTFATLDSVKGQPGAEFTLSFLGGTEKGESWVVPGMPTFAVGEETIVFTSGDKSICPLVGAMHGRYRVLNDPARNRRYVARDNQEALTSTDDVVAPMESSTNAQASSIRVANALTPEEFVQRISAEIAHPTRPATLR